MRDHAAIPEASGSGKVASLALIYGPEVCPAPPPVLAT